MPSQELGAFTRRFCQRFAESEHSELTQAHPSGPRRCCVGTLRWGLYRVVSGTRRDECDAVDGCASAFANLAASHTGAPRAQPQPHAPPLTPARTRVQPPAALILAVSLQAQARISARGPDVGGDPWCRKSRKSLCAPPAASHLAGGAGIFEAPCSRQGSVPEARESALSGGLESRAQAELLSRRSKALTSNQVPKRINLLVRYCGCTFRRKEV